MSIATWSWLILAFPLAGFLICSLLWKALPPRVAGVIASLGDRARLRLRGRGDDQAAGPARRCAAGHLVALGLRQHRRRQRPARHLRRSAGDVHVPGRLGRQLPDPRLLDRLHEVGPRLQPLLLLPQLLRVLDAAAGAGRQLRAADRRLGLRRLRLLRADQLLVPAHDRDQGRHEGLRDQRDRRHRAGAGSDPDLAPDRLARLHARSSRERRRCSRRTRG